MKSEHGRSCNDSSMGGGGGTQPRAPSATATVNEELGGSERDGDGGSRGGGLVGGHGGVGMRVGGVAPHEVWSGERLEPSCAICLPLSNTTRVTIF